MENYIVSVLANNPLVYSLVLVSFEGIRSLFPNKVRTRAFQNSRVILK